MSSAKQLRVVFLDDGGVMNDNALRAPQWRRLIGEFMPQHLGGTAEQWSEANAVQFPRFWAEILPRMAEFASHAEYQRAYDYGWLGAMCSHIRIATPPEAEASRIATEATEYITSRVQSAYPDASDAIRALRAAGFELHTASGSRSWELANFLRVMGVGDCFGQLCGPDLVDVMKASPEYYRRVFTLAGVAPSRAIVIDDGERHCAWAESVGATAIRVDRTRQTSGPGVMPDLATAAAWLIESFSGRREETTEAQR